MHRYLVFCDERFLEQAVEEIRAVEPRAKFESTGALTKKTPIMVSTETDLASKDFVFIDALFPVIAEKKGYQFQGELAEMLAPALQKQRSMRIEVIRINSPIKENAKSTEVKVGSMLEARGFAVDLKDPQIIVYLLLTSGRAIAAVGDAADGIFVADRFREIVNRKEQKVSRSEYKLEEAFRYFKLKMKRSARVLDVGAAPGGWTNYMLKQGASVVAVDNAELVVKSPYVTHIKKRLQHIDMRELEREGKYDFLLLDVNINPSESAKLAAGLADILNNGAHLILTIKLVDARIGKHIEDVRGILSQKYDGIRAKKLPHNREEVTCVATRR